MTVIFVVGTYKLVGKETVSNAVDAALRAGYRLIGEFDIYVSLMIIRLFVHILSSVL